MRAALALLLPFVLISNTFGEPRDRFVEDGTFLVASIDVGQLVEPDAAKRLLEGLEAIEQIVGDGVVPPVEQREKGTQFVAKVLQQVGVRRAFVAAAIDDIRIGYAPLVVCQLDEGSDPQQLTLLCDSMKSITTEVVDDQVWISTPKSLERYHGLRSAERPDLLQALVSVGHSDPLLSVVIAPGSDARRVIRELWPTLPKSLGVLTGPLIAEGFERIELTARLEDSVSCRLAVVARNEASRQRFSEFATAGLEQGVAWIQQNQPKYAELATKAIEVLTPQTEGNTLSIDLSTEALAVQELIAGVLAPAIQQGIEASRRASKMNSMKQLALAMLNFESANGCYPGPIVNEQGKPLLSWRVAILPYLEEQALFNQFHLDEPWDSEHNLEVAKSIPFSLANPSHNELNVCGLTTYLRPVYPGSDLSAVAGKNEPIAARANGKKIFYAAGDPIRQITDGTSNTILIAEVAPEHAVFWTKPDDWQVDLDDPMAKLRTDKRDGFVTAFHDGHAKYAEFTMPIDILRAIITKAGREVVVGDGKW